MRFHGLEVVLNPAVFLLHAVVRQIGVFQGYPGSHFFQFQSDCQFRIVVVIVKFLGAPKLANQLTGYKFKVHARYIGVANDRFIASLPFDRNGKSSHGRVAARVKPRVINYLC